jgi:hypothetical protein
MPVEFREHSITVPSGTGRRRIRDFVTFGSNVIRVGIALNGFQLDYVNSDHHINVVEVDTDIVAINGNAVTLQVECDYADKNLDDAYRGYVTVLVIAEVV